MEDNILVTIKKLLGIDASYEEFDTDIIVNINSAMFTLDQLGVDFPYGVYTIDKDSEWSDIFDDTQLDVETVKMYLYLKVRQIFDPPSSSVFADTIQAQINELEWRLNVSAENRHKAWEV